MSTRSAGKTVADRVRAGLRPAAELASVVGALVAVGALAYTVQVAERQNDQSNRQQALAEATAELENAPALAAGAAPGTGPSEVTLRVAGRPLTKEADALRLARKSVIVPVYNVGAGVAAVRGVSVLIRTSCSRIRELVARARRPGADQQLGYNNVGERDTAQVVRPFRTVEQYRAARRANQLRVFLSYSDFADRYRRYTCVTYTRPGPSDRWTVSTIDSGVIK